MIKQKTFFFVFVAYFKIVGLQTLKLKPLPVNHNTESPLLKNYEPENYVAYENL